MRRRTAVRRTGRAAVCVPGPVVTVLNRLPVPFSADNPDPILAANLPVAPTEAIP